MIKQGEQDMNKKFYEEKKILIEEFTEEDWLELMKRPPAGFSWSEEAFLIGEEYVEDDKEFIRSN
jgi:hypothetical protein